MKAERKEVEPKFVPVIVTLESQEEVDALFAIGNDVRICCTLPALDGMYNILKMFKSNYYEESCDKLDDIVIK